MHFTIYILKASCSDEQNKRAEEQREKVVYTENGITYDTRPLSERMSSVLPETIQSAPQVEDTLSCTEVATTLKEIPHDIEQQISQPELAQVI